MMKIRHIEHTQAGRWQGEAGQLFPFLTVIAILLLVAVMAFINTSQVNLRKTQTMIAADAAALGGASQMASAANMIKDTNTNTLWANYEFEMMYMSLIPAILGPYNARIGLFAGHAYQNTETFLNLVVSGFKATQQAGGSAIQMTFANMQVEEASQRNLTMTGDLLESRLSNYLDEQHLYKKDTLITFDYNWTQHSYNISTGQQQPLAGESVFIKIQKPEENCFVLEPMPALPLFTAFMWYIPPCLAFDGCILCGANVFLVNAGRAMAEWEIVGLKYVMGALIGMAAAIDYFQEGYFHGPSISTIINTVIAYLSFDTGFSPVMCNGPGADSIEAGKSVDNQGGCGQFIFDYCFFIFPIPYIRDMENKDASVSVEVTRLSPVKDLGLFQFNEQGITSGAKVGMVGGTVNPFAPDVKFQIRAHDVWDGEKL